MTVSPTPTVQGVTAEEVEAVRAAIHAQNPFYAHILKPRPIAEAAAQVRTEQDGEVERKLDDTRADLALANEELFFLRAGAKDDRFTITDLKAALAQTAEANERLREVLRKCRPFVAHHDQNAIVGSVKPLLAKIDAALLSDLKTETDGAGALEPLTRTEQILQAYRCSCRGTDDLCPCQNAPDQQTRTARRALASENGGRDE